MEDPLYFWRLAPELSVVNAAILVTGGDPAEVERYSISFDEYEERQKTTGHAGFVPVFAALKAAIKRGELPAKLRYRGRKGGEYDPSPDNPFWIVSPVELEAAADPERAHMRKLSSSTSIYIESEPDWDDTTVDVPDLRKWLASRGHATGFFFPSKASPSEASPDDFMDPDHDHYAPELALAVKAWRALASTQKMKGGVKATLEKWLLEHPEEWGPLAVTGDGKKNNGADLRERLTTVANWNKGGGSPRSNG
ncbi:hypothetical protein [Paenirhodobacter enshiensis]|uniref:hypothetical protein n=1 Tax=Paenirhodobacter enshiensis TaxID=1105367 RepID=UPI0035B3A857